MKIDKSTIFTIVITLIVGVVLGSFLFNGKDNENLTEHEHEVSEVTGLWTCSMHPQVQASDPGSCPFCGMDLIPVASDDTGGNPQALKMSAAAMQLANIQTSIIGEGSSNSNLVLNGRVKADTRQVNVQTTHFAARIEKLYKNFEGEVVRKGDKIATLYSPQLVTAQEELIEAKKMEASNPVLLEAARKKLHHWKLSMEQIQEIETSSKPMRNFDLLSDYDGVISKKMVNTGDHLKEGGVLLEVTDLTKVWAVFEVYEKDLQFLKVGQQISFSSSSSSNQVFDGKIAFIEPTLNVNKRVIEIRVDVDNRKGLLKPDMFLKGNVSLGESKKGISVPKSAVLWTGERSIVYLKTIDESGSYFQLREVKLGTNSGDAYEILEGLAIGDEVVTNGAFTLDAEAQLKGKVSMMNPSASEIEIGGEAEFQLIDLPVVKNFLKTTDPAFQKQLNLLTNDYIQLKDEMVKGQASSIKNASDKVTQSLSKVDMKLTKGEAHMHWMALLTPMQTSLDKIILSKNRDAQRLEFINLSKAMINAVESFGVGNESPLYIQFCPMANDNKGATWISLNENIINPYFGDAMLTCGSVESVIGQ